MWKLILSTLSTIALLLYAPALSSQSGFSLSLDANSLDGDQAFRSLNVAADQDVEIQLFGRGLLNARGISARFEYDESQVTYEGFDAEGALPGAQVFAEYGTGPTSVLISVVSLGSTTTADVGLVGTIRFRTGSAFSGTTIDLVYGELARDGQVESVTLNASVDLQSPSWDFDGDGRVGFFDFVLFGDRFGSRSGYGTYEAKYDLDSNGTVGFSDFVIFANNFGKRVSPPGGGRSDSTPKMYWADGGLDRIQRADLDGGNVEDLVTTGLTTPRGIALDVAGGRMYWADYGTDKIQRADLNGNNVEDLVTTGLIDPSGIALDVSGGKMYWTDGGTDKIQRADLDGSNVEDLITTGLAIPTGIALDVSGGKMYWSGWNTHKIQRADLDGDNVEDLVTGLNNPYGVALDVSGGKLYWADRDTRKIQRADLDGDNVEDLVTGLNNPAGIALDVSAGKMYWTDVSADKIQRADLDGSNVEDLVTTGLSSPTFIALVVSPDLVVESPSASVRALSAGSSFTLGATVRNVGVASSAPTVLRYYVSTDSIMSPSDTEVGVDAVGSLTSSSSSDVSVRLKVPYASGAYGAYYYGACVESVAGERATDNNCSSGVEVRIRTRKMYWVDSGTNKIQRANMNGSNVEDLVTTGLSDPMSIALDLFGGKMYWTDLGAEKIQRADLDGSNVEDLVTTGLSGPRGIALDVSGGKMYWADPGTDKIQRANLDGSNVEDLVTTGLSHAGFIALVVSGGKMYWTDGGTTAIHRADLDGSNVEGLVGTGSGHLSNIALDVYGGKMYWTNWGTKEIRRADLDGSNVEDLISTTGTANPYAIALDVSGGKVYWTDLSLRAIRRADLDGSNVEYLVYTGLSNPTGIALSLSPDPD